MPAIISAQQAEPSPQSRTQGYCADMSCPGCGTALTEQKKRRHATYCSTRCRIASWTAHHAKLNPRLNLPTGTTGAIGELAVALDLMRRGYEVFRALSQACSCDLAVLKDGRLLRIEVRTGYLGQGGKFSWPRNKDDSKHDVYAVVLSGGTRIEYVPGLP